MFAANFLLAVLFLVLFWGIAKALKRAFPVFEKLFLPSSLIAGVLALAATALFGVMALTAVPESVLDTWAGVPILLINVVFACLFLGKKILTPKKTWQLAGPQVVFGQTLAWGQYVFGIILAMLVLTPVFGLSPLSGALIEISFEGGHGTAAGLRPVFEELGFAVGADLAIGLATIGIISGMLTGIILVNWAHKTKKLAIPEEAAQPKSVQRKEATSLDDQAHPPTPHWLRDRKLLSLLVHVGYIVAAILIGRMLLDWLILLETLTWASNGGLEIMRYIPLFPLAMIGGVIVQYILHKLNATILIDRAIISRIGTLALDVLIITAVATVSLSALGEYLVPFTLIALTGIAWNLFGVLFIAPKVIPKYWFERGIGDYGQSMGMTATGLLLMKVTDPKNHSQALESFGYKQLFFEPIVGGGIFTASALILIHQLGSMPMLILTAAIMSFWLIFGQLYFGRKKFALDRP